MSKSNGAAAQSPENPLAITALSVSGFKSIVGEQTIEIRPLTILAGANSSGKSSMMQPLLLLKQTLEAPYDPGPLLLNGPNVKLTSASQCLPTPLKGKKWRLEISLFLNNKSTVTIVFGWDDAQKRLLLESNVFKRTPQESPLRIEFGGDETLVKIDSIEHEELQRLFSDSNNTNKIKINEFKIFRNKFLLMLIPLSQMPTQLSNFNELVNGIITSILLKSFPVENINFLIQNMIHVPGLRGNPVRAYPVSAIGPMFPGTLESYVASLVAHWSSDSPGKIKELSDDLKLLGLTWKIEATPINDTQVELRVGRLPRPKKGGAHDLVSIADVGFGVSQTLPVVVALRAANPGQLVYIEQPEIHLHPRAQVAMARLLVNAANRGIRVVAETHSSLLLLAVQTLVAEGAIDPSLVGLNWFLRSKKDGTTRIKTAELDEAGRFGDWPEDFDEVALEAENRYLTAAESRLAKE
jgi:hypothetical protein